MEVEKTNSSVASNKEEDEEDVPLPGFRFHPTDEELVGFYLRRKVEKKPISIELIKQIDIYKYDPWDLPKGSNVGDKEWYFFCRRGRKYRNSIRPNRVTGSGFWKATGIDRPIHSADEGRDCVGLKKSLVYYRGSAGKGTKTDWMMHEFRLPPVDYNKSTNKNKQSDVKNAVSQQEAEVWTLCRIFKRNVSYRKCMPDWRELSARRNNAVEPSPKTCSSSIESDSMEGYNISFENPNAKQYEKKPFFQTVNQLAVGHLSSLCQAAPYPSDFSQAPPLSTASSYQSAFNPDINEQLLKYGDWDELRSIVDFATDGLIM